MKSPHWRRWLGPEHRRLVPLISFSESDTAHGKKMPAWFGDIWCNWTSVRKVKEGEVNADLCGFLTTEPNDVVRPVHPKAMPVILTEADEMDVWMRALGRGSGIPEAVAGRRADGRDDGQAKRPRRRQLKSRPLAARTRSHR